LTGRPFLRQPAILAVAAIGVSSTVFLGYLAHLTSSAHLLVYHFPGKPSAIFVPVIADVLLLAAVCFAAFVFLRERSTRHRVFWSLILSIYPWIFVRNFFNILQVRVPRAVSLAIFALCAAGFLLLTLVRSDAMNRAFVELQKFGVTMFVASGIVGTLALLEATWFGVKARHLNDPPVVEAVARQANIAPHGRVLWIVLDELGYRQLYESRLPDLELPAFDRVRGESTVFTDVQPAGFDTDIVLPALMTGDAVNRIRSTADGRLVIHDARGWRLFDEHDTVFSDANALGYRSAVVGWFNPYCRILATMLDSCLWVNHSAIEGFGSNRGIALSLLHPVAVFASRLPRFFGFNKKTLPLDRQEEGQRHIEEFMELNKAADAALSDSRNNFLLVHMPIPHPEGIWERRTGQFAIDLSSYVDNLALADAYLGHVRDLLEANGQWDGTTVVIMGDHALRTAIWKDLPSWSGDDQLASDGDKFDQRPAYLIKLPYQHTPAIVQAAFPAVRTRALLDELLEGGITSPAQLKQWVSSGELSSGSPAVN
jgi:hypothetical protein